MRSNRWVEKHEIAQFAARLCAIEGCYEQAFHRSPICWKHRSSGRYNLDGAVYRREAGWERSTQNGGWERRDSTRDEAQQSPSALLRRPSALMRRPSQQPAREDDSIVLVGRATEDGQGQHLLQRYHNVRIEVKGRPVYRANDGWLFFFNAALGGWCVADADHFRNGSGKAYILASDAAMHPEEISESTKWWVFDPRRKQHRPAESIAVRSGQNFENRSSYSYGHADFPIEHEQNVLLSPSGEALVAYQKLSVKGGDGGPPMQEIEVAEDLRTGAKVTQRVTFAGSREYDIPTRVTERRWSTPLLEMSEATALVRAKQEQEQEQQSQLQLLKQEDEAEAEAEAEAAYDGSYVAKFPTSHAPGNSAAVLSELDRALASGAHVLARRKGLLEPAIVISGESKLKPGCKVVRFDADGKCVPRSPADITSRAESLAVLSWKATMDGEGDATGAGSGPVLARKQAMRKLLLGKGSAEIDLCLIQKNADLGDSCLGREWICLTAKGRNSSSVGIYFLTSKLKPIGNTLVGPIGELGGERIAQEFEYAGTGVRFVVMSLQAPPPDLHGNVTRILLEQVASVLRENFAGKHAIVGCNLPGMALKTNKTFSTGDYRFFRRKRKGDMNKEAAPDHILTAHYGRADESIFSDDGRGRALSVELGKSQAILHELFFSCNLTS